MSIEAMKLALEALKHFELAGLSTLETIDAITSLSQAIEQAQKQEPVAWKTDDIELYVREDKFGFYNIPLYTSPPPRQPPQFPTMLRKMWSGTEVQEWINENWNKP